MKIKKKISILFALILVIIFTMLSFVGCVDQPGRIRGTNGRYVARFQRQSHFPSQPLLFSNRLELTNWLESRHLENSILFVNYTETFFETHQLIILGGFFTGSNGYFEMVGVSYRNNNLTVEIREGKFWQTIVLGYAVHWSVFIEITRISPNLNVELLVREYQHEGENQ